MNHWQAKQMPHSWHPSNTTLLWGGPDREDNPHRHTGVWPNTHIDYKFNDHGFRTHNMTKLLGQSVDIALGCSFTEGVGLPVEAVWPNLIELERPYPMLNLGIGGASTDTVARILTNVAGLYDIKSVCILWPDIARFEQYFPDDAESPILSFTPALAGVEHVWYMDKDNSEQRFNRNRQIVHLLRDMYGFELVEQHLPIALKTIPFEPARDGCHWGFKPNQTLAKWFLNKLTT